MGMNGNRYYGEINKESQIRSNSFHSRLGVRKYKVDSKQTETQEATPVSSSAANPASSELVTTSTNAAISTTTSTVATSSVVAGGTAAAVATAAVVIVASVFVPTVSDFEYESTASTLSYSFALSYQSGTSGVVKLENRFEKYEEFFELTSYFEEEETEKAEKGFIDFKEGMFTGLTASTTYRLSVSIYDGDTKYDVFDEKVKTTDVPASDFVITAALTLNEETDCLDGTISVEDPGNYFQEGSLKVRIVGNYAEYPVETEMSGNEYEESYEDETERPIRDYTITDLNATQSFYVGGMDGGEYGLSLTVYATSTYDGEPKTKQYLEQKYAYTREAPVYTINFYNEDGTDLLSVQLVTYGEEIVYEGETNLEEVAERRTTNTTISTFLGWATEIGGEVYDWTYYAWEDMDFYAVFSEETRYYSVVFMNEDGTEVLAIQNAEYGERAQWPYSDEPAKDSTDTVQYFFAGWADEVGGMPSEALPPVFEETTYYAVFEEGDRYYTVNFYDGDYLITSTEVTYGTPVCFDELEDGSGYDFYKEADAGGCYSFDCFLDSENNTINPYDEFYVTGDMDIYAHYVVTAESVHTIFYNYDGTTVLQDNYQMAYFGIEYGGGEPTRDDTAASGAPYFFACWRCEETGEMLTTEELQSFDASSYGNGTLTFIAVFEESV